MRYFIGGFTWEGKSQIDRFINEGIWENGYEEEKYANLFSQISIGDMFALKSTFVKGRKPNAKSYLRIKQIGIVTNLISKSSIGIKWLKSEEFDLTDIKNITVMKKGMTNRSFRFSCRDILNCKHLSLPFH